MTLTSFEAFDKAFLTEILLKTQETSDHFMHLKSRFVTLQHFNFLPEALLAAQIKVS